MMYVSIAITVLGLMMYLLGDAHIQPNYSVFTDGAKFTISGFFAELEKLSPTAIMTLGIMVLMFIPFVRVLTAFIEYVISKNTRYIIYTAIIIVVIICSVFLGAQH